MNGNSGSQDLGQIEVPASMRKAYLEAVNCIVPCDELEEDDIRYAMQWLDTAISLHKPHNMEEHLGVFSVVLSPDKKYTFLINHKKAQLWLPPGGHVDYGVSLGEAARSELQEELGIEHPVLIRENPIFLTRTLTQGLNAGHIDVTTWFIFEEEVANAYRIQEKEASEGKWFLVSEIMQNQQFANLHRGFHKLAQLLLP